MNTILRLVAWRRYLCYASLLFMVIIGIWSGASIGRIASGLSKSKVIPFIISMAFLEVMVVVSCVLMLKILSKIKLIIDDNGISYFQWGIRVEAKWSDLEKVVPNWYGLPIYSGVQVSATSVHGSQFTVWLNKYLGLNRLVPISLFSSAWQSNEIGDIIFKCAPQLKKQ